MGINRVGIILFTAFVFFQGQVPVLAAEAPRRITQTVTSTLPILTLKESISIAKDKNFDIRQLREQVQSSEARTRQTLAPSTPSFSISYNDMTSAFVPNTTSSAVYQLIQPLAFPGKAFFNRSILSEQTSSLEAQLKGKELEVATNVAIAYYQLALARKNLQLNTDLEGSYEKILSVAKRRYETGAITQVDYLNAEVALYSNHNDRNDLVANEKSVRAQLNALLVQPADRNYETESLKMELHPPINLEEARSKMLQQRFEIKSATSLANAANKTSQLSWMSILPDFQLTLGTTSYRYLNASPVVPIAQTYMAGLQFTIPLWFAFNERETIVSTGHDRASAEATLNSLLQQSEVDLETTLANLESLQAKIQNYENHLLPVVEQAFNIALISYSSGKIDFPNLADTAAARRNTKRDYYSTLVNYATTYAGYGRLIGEETP